MGRLEGKVAAITGGASGIGTAIVERFVAEGACVAFADWAHARGEELAERLGASTLFVAADVSDEQAATGFIE